MSGLSETIKRQWKKNISLWMIPDSFTAQEKALVIKAQKRVRAYSPYVWFSSSGSSRKSGIKFYGHTRESLECSAKAVNSFLKITKKDHVLNVLPLYHVGGFGTWLRTQIASCPWTDLSSRKWSPQDFHKTLEEKQITVTSLVPTQIHDLTELQMTSPETLRAVVVGGGALNQDLYKKGRKLGWPLLPSYGMTEFGSQIATASLASLKNLNFPSVRTLEHIRQITQKEPGTFIRSDAGCTYQLEMSPDGLFTMEAKRREHGILVDDRISYDDKTKEIQVLGRKHRVVKVLGELVSLDRLEEKARPFLKQVSFFTIVSLPDDRLENKIFLVIEKNKKTNPNLVSADVKKFNESCKGFERIQGFEVLIRIPKTDLGKVKHEEVKRSLTGKNGF